MVSKFLIYGIVISLIVATIFISGCIQQTKSVCGDGVCESGENEENCPGDCIGLDISWESMNGPPGGRFTKLIQNPYNTSELYTLTGTGVYKSEDKGESWELMEDSEHFEAQSIAVYEDKVFVCGNGLFYYDKEENLKQLPNKWCNVVTVSDNKVFISNYGKRIGDVRILYSDLDGDRFDWKDITPSESELSDLEFPPADLKDDYYIVLMSPHVVALGNRILASMFVKDNSGSGEFSNGYVYVSNDLGNTWSKLDFGMPKGVIPAQIVQNPANPSHVVLSFRHSLVHEVVSPMSTLLRESFDGGVTWSQLRGLEGTNIDSNGVTSVDIVDSTYYILNPFAGPSIIKLSESGYEFLECPRVEQFYGITFCLGDIVIDSDNPSIVYGMADPLWALGLVKSVDGMNTWKKMDGDIIASTPTIVLTHPTDTNVIFTSGNVIQESYATRDWGSTWEPFSPSSAGDEARIDPHNPNHILLVSEMTDIFESYDSGVTFTRIAQDFSSAKIFDFEIAKDDSEKIYVSNIGVGISEYLGNNQWHYLTNSPDYVYDMEIDPENSNILYAAYSPKIFENHSSIWRYSKYQEENSGWSEILRVEDSKGITSLKFDPSNPNKIYAGVVGEEGEIYVSNDKGNTWNKLNDHFTMLTVWGQPQLIVDPNNPSIAYAATWLAGTWKTTDAGESWTLLEDAPISSTALSLDKTNTNVIYLADRSSPTVWKSIDSGETWEQVADFSSDRALLVMSVMADGDTVYASTFYPSLRGGKLYKSTDAGATWSDITGTLPVGILDLAVDPTNHNIVYLTTNVHGAYKSTDSGASWNKMENFPDVGAYDIEVDPDDPTILYTASRGGSMPSWFTEIAGVIGGINFTDSAGVYKSTDSGSTWSNLLTTSVSCRAIRRHPDNPDLFFSPDLVDGLQVSADGGETWTKYNEGLDNCVPTSVAVNGDKIYVGTQGCGVYSGDVDSTTGEITWQPGRSNKPVPRVYNLQIRIDPTNSNNIFVSSYPGGLYASTNGGAKFGDRNAITPSVVVFDPIVQGYYTFAIDPNDPTKMWLGTWGKGIYKSYNSMILDVPMGLFGKHINQIVVDPDDSNTVYAATKEGVFVTRDDGENWEGMNEGLDTLDVRSLRITSAEFPPFEDDFEDGNADGWKLEDGWSVIQEGGNYLLEGIGHKWVRSGSESWSDYTFESRVKLIEGGVHVNYRLKESEGERYFVGVYEGNLNLVRMFTENRNPVHTKLAKVDFPFGETSWNTIKIVGKGNNIKVYVNDELKIDYTDDNPVLSGGIAFETLDDSRVYVDDIQVTVDKLDSVVYAGTAGYGVYKLIPPTNKWQSLGKTLGSGFWSAWDRRMYQFSSILFDPEVPGKVYYGHFPSGFFISEDNGHTWVDSSLGLGNDGMFSLSMHPHNHSILFAGTYNGVAKSVDGGETWELKSTGMPSEQWPYTVAIDDQNPNIMYTSTKNGQNKGFCHRNEDTFCGVVMKSTDGGESWFEIMDGLDPISEFYTLIIYPPNHNILFLSTNKGVYASRNAGNSWVAINSGLPSTNNQVRDNVADNLALTPDNKYLVLGLMEYGVWKADLSKIA